MIIININMPGISGWEFTRVHNNFHSFVHRNTPFGHFFKISFSLKHIFAIGINQK